MKKGVALEDGEKYGITVSEDKLIHKLLIKDCSKSDKGIYSAIAGMTSCSAWLVVEGNMYSFTQLYFIILYQCDPLIIINNFHICVTYCMLHSVCFKLRRILHLAARSQFVKLPWLV